MNKIYIFENTNSLHVEESLITLKEIFSDKNEVIFCLNNKAINRVHDNNNIMESCIPMTSYLESINFFRKIDDNDLVVYPTISARNICILFVLSLFVSKNIYYIRNSNSWLKYSNHQKNILFKLISNITTFFKKKLLKKAYQIFVANSNLKNYLLSHNIENQINIVPYKFFDETNVKQLTTGTRFKFVVPGGIDLAKKDLTLIRSAVSYLSQSDMDKIEIILLGKPAKKSDLDFCNEWKKEVGNTLHFYTSFIPDNEFSNVMKDSHFVLSVLNIKHQDKYNDEIYGVSKDTGVDAQAIAYGKPLIINSEFYVVNEIETSSVGFDSAEHLSKIIKIYIDNNNYENIANKALINCKKLSLKSLSEKLVNI